MEKAKGTDMLKENLENFLEIETQHSQDIAFVFDEIREMQEQKNVEPLQDLVALNVRNSFDLKKEPPKPNLSKVMDTVVDSLNKSVQHKSSAFLELDEIEGLKNSLSDNLFSVQMVSIVKDELTKFENQIKENHSKKIQEINEERASIDSQIDELNSLKQEIMTKRLSQMLWPFDERTKMIDKKIGALKLKDQRCSEKISETLIMAPVASEKDILIFQTQMEQKFAG